MALIPPFVLEDIKSRVSLSDLMDAEIGLTKLKKMSGENRFQACCPFHDDKNPSLLVDDDGGNYHCFGCGEHGDAFDLLVLHRGHKFIEAVEKLCDWSGYDIESVMADLAEIDSVPVEHKKSVKPFPYTNFLFNCLTSYNPYLTKSKVNGLNIPTSMTDMQLALAGRNYLSDATNCDHIKQLLDSDLPIKEVANGIGVLENLQLTYPEGCNLLPVMSVGNISMESKLPYIVNENSQDQQFHCSGFITLDSNLEPLGVYPEAVVKQQSGILTPPPSQIDLLNNLNCFYITESAGQYIDLICCGMTNIVAPAIGELNHQHLRQMSKLPTNELIWVTTPETLSNPLIISKLAIFSETIGSSKTMSVAFLKNTNDAPFSSLVINHPDKAERLIHSQKMPLHKVIHHALPTLEILEGRQKDFAIRAVCQMIKSLHKDNQVEAAVSLLESLASSCGQSTIELIASITKVNKKVLISGYENLRVPEEYLEPNIHTLIGLRDTLDKVDKHNILFEEKLAALRMPGDSKLMNDYALASSNHQLALELLTEVTYRNSPEQKELLEESPSLKL